VYLGAGEGLAKGHRAKDFRHERLLLYVGDSANIVIDLHFLQLVKRNSCRVSAIGVVPHAVGPSSERLYLMLYKSANELDARKLFLGRGSKLLDFLHQRLYDLHFLVRELVPPRHPGSKNCGGSKFLKPEVFASGGLILGIKPFRPPAEVVFGHLEIEVRDIRAHLAAKATSLIAQGVPDGENPAPKRPMGLDPQETLTEHDKTRNVHDCIGIQIMKLNPIREEKATKKRVWGEATALGA
jgi:hypothetical protein